MLLWVMGVVYAETVTDYPDFQNFPNAQSDNVFASFAQVLTPGVHNGAMLPALSWSSLMVIVSPLTGACQVPVNHFAASTSASTSTSPARGT